MFFKKVKDLIFDSKMQCYLGLNVKQNELVNAKNGLTPARSQIQ